MNLKDFIIMLTNTNTEAQKAKNKGIENAVDKMKDNYSEYYDSKAKNAILGRNEYDTSLTDNLRKGVAAGADYAGGQFLGSLAGNTVDLVAGAKGASKAKELKGALGKLNVAPNTIKEGVHLDNPKEYEETFNNILNLRKEYEIAKAANKKSIMQKIGTAIGFITPSALLYKFDDNKINKAKNVILSEIYPEEDFDSMSDRERDAFIKEHYDELNKKLSHSRSNFI